MDPGSGNAVRSPGAADYSTLTSRVFISSAPYAIRATTAGTAMTVAASGVGTAALDFYMDGYTFAGNVIVGGDDSFTLIDMGGVTLRLGGQRVRGRFATLARELESRHAIATPGPRPDVGAPPLCAGLRGAPHGP